MESPSFDGEAKTLCRSLLSSPWSDLPLDEIKVEPINKGRSNRLFICSRPEITGKPTTSNCNNITSEAYQQSSLSGLSVRSQVDQSTKVIVRFYGSEFTGKGNQYKCVSDEEEIEILNILSSRGLSPFVLKSFPGGRIDEYIESKILEPVELLQIDKLILLGPKIAQYHGTSFKCSKTYNLVQIYRENISKANQILSSYKASNLTDCLPESIQLLEKVKQFYQNNQPVHQLIEKMVGTQQRSVFAHMDLNHTNFLFCKKLNNASPIESFDVMIIDVENSQNNYRGIDLGKFFSELCLGDGLIDIPDSSIGAFIDSYLNEWKLIVDPEQFNPSIDNQTHLLLEVRLGFLFTTLFQMTWNVIHPNFTTSDNLLNNTVTRIDIFNHYNQRWSEISQTET